MPVKRPAGLGNLESAPAPQDQAVKITDTMTLVVKDQDGLEVRVKESGRQGGVSPAQQAAAPGKPRVESILDKILFEDLKVLEMLGAGAQGKVRKAQHRVTGELYALKSIAFSDDKDATRDVLRAELKRLAALSHPNIVTSYEAYFREGKLYIVLELMDCGTLTHVIKKWTPAGGIPEEILSYIALRFLRGLAHLHSSRIIHRDIKPGNLLLSSAGEVKISDFGVAKDFSKQASSQTLAAVGSTPYMSPERVKGEPYSFQCDVWSFGLTIAEAAIGQYPFANLKGNTFALCQAIAGGNAKINWELGPRTPSAELQDFVDQCLKPVESRPAPETLQEHPFIQKGATVDAVVAGLWLGQAGVDLSVDEVKARLANGTLKPAACLKGGGCNTGDGSSLGTPGSSMSSVQSPQQAE